MRPGYLVAFWLLVLGATSLRVDLGLDQEAPERAPKTLSMWPGE
jgi:hypothetical protein